MTWRSRTLAEQHELRITVGRVHHRGLYRTVYEVEMWCQDQWQRLRRFHTREQAEEYMEGDEI